MFKFAQVFAPPEHAVQSLAVQAQMAQPARIQSRFELLVRHFLRSFLNNEMASSDGEAKSRIMQVGYAVALPQLLVALFLFPPYHAPIARPYWSQVGDRYFYVLYSMVATGAATVFQWDLFFPQAVDVFVLSSLPVSARKLFEARIAAILIFLLAVILGVNFLGIFFFPASCDLASPARHLFAHLIAVTAGGIFIASFILAFQEVLLAALGQRLFQRISPILQGFFITTLLIALFLFPVLSQFLRPVLESSSRWATWFPPFWFLGMYERLLIGPGAAPEFGALAARGVLGCFGAMALAALFYPLAYWRRMQMMVEGRAERDTRSWLDRPANAFLHAWMVRLPVRRAIYHFIGTTLFRTHRHRVYLAMYGGVGVALAIAGAVLLRIDGKGGVGILFSADGLRAAVPIVAFWTIAGLRNAFVSPVDQRGSWVFKVIQGRPGLDLLMPARNWVLLWATTVTLAVVGLEHAIAPALRGRADTTIQIVAAISLCLLLRDLFLLRTVTIPFAGVRPTSGMNLAHVLIQYFGLFPPLIFLTLDVESWMRISTAHILLVVIAAVALHLYLRAWHRKIAGQHADLLDVDDEEEEFPQRLGLRY